MDTARRLGALGIALLLAAGCGGGGDAEETAGNGGTSGAEASAPAPNPASVPGEVVRAFLEAFKKGNDGFDEGVEMFTPKAREFYVLLRERKGKDTVPVVVGFEILKESIEGEWAKVTVSAVYRKLDGGERRREEGFLLRKHGDDWRIFAIGALGKEENFETALEALKAEKE